MNVSRIGLAVTSALAAVSIAACGGSGTAPGPRDDIASRVNEFWADLISGDGEAACAMGTPGFNEAMARSNVHQGDGRDSCAAFVELLAGQTDDPLQIEASAADVTVRGQVAIVKAGGYCFGLVKPDMRWLITAIPTPNVAGVPCKLAGA